MHVLLAGNFRFPWYESACAEALEELGHRVTRFSWRPFFDSPVGRLEERLASTGPATLLANRALVRTARISAPDALIVWRGTHVTEGVLKRLRRQQRVLLASYNNDDPYGPAYSGQLASLHQRRLWLRFRRAIPCYDLNLVYRQVNADEYRDAGARNVQLLLPYFVPRLHAPRELNQAEVLTFGCEVVFVGHYEPDGRADCLRALINAGIKLRLFGTGWPVDEVMRIFGRAVEVRPVYGDDYAKALNGASLCLSFHSRLNRDTYTRRSFEIPACGRPMVSERSPDLERLFTDEREAIFFDDPGSLVCKVSELLREPHRRDSIAKAGLARVWKDGHDVKSRMAELAELLTAPLKTGERPS